MRWKRGLRQNPWLPSLPASSSLEEPVTHFFSSTITLTFDLTTNPRVARHLVSSTPIVFNLESEQFIPFEGGDEEGPIMGEIRLLEPVGMFKEGDK